MLKKIMAVSILAILFVMSGCEDRYRYACQDPENWKNAECNRPQCVASGSCTDMIIEQEESTKVVASKPLKPQKGDCK